MRILPVDTNNVEQRNLLIGLQVSLLPFDTHADTHRGHWWFAKEGQELVGFGGLFMFHQGDPRVAILCRAGVVPAHQGKGIQKLLIKARIKFAKDSGATQIVTDTTINPPSVNSLIACGFRMHTPDIPWCADGALYWRKQVTP